MEHGHGWVGGWGSGEGGEKGLMGICSGKQIGEVGEVERKGGGFMVEGEVRFGQGYAP